ncbi:hypothetical protein D3C72_1888690 [compost metagenome]
MELVGDEDDRQALGHHLVDGVVVGLLHAQRDRGEHALALHVLHELDVVQVEAVHHVEVAVLREPQADRLVDHRFHVGRHHRQAEGALAQRDAGVAFRAAFHAAFARQQKDVVVIEDLHDQAPERNR